MLVTVRAILNLCVCVAGMNTAVSQEWKTSKAKHLVRHEDKQGAPMTETKKEGAVSVDIGAKGIQVHQDSHIEVVTPSANEPAKAPVTPLTKEPANQSKKETTFRALLSARSRSGEGDCPGKIEGHAKCTEGEKIAEGKTCTWKCDDDLTAKPTTSKCKCDASSCGLEPSAVECSSGCFPASAKVLRPNGVETSVASMHKGDKVLGLSRSWEPEEHTYLADFHTGQPAQHSRHRFLEIRHACQTGNPLLITSTHLLYAVEASPDKFASGKFRLMPAGSLKPGVHAVLAMGCPGEEGLAASNVLSIAVVWAEGLYSPFVNSGTAIVDGVATSNLALNSESIEKAWYAMPYLQGFAEQLGWLHLAPAQLCAMMGWSVDWVSDKHMQDKINWAVDKILHFTLRWTA